MPKGIRPTQQKVRKAIFDILSERVKGAAFLELFAGSGAVGIEAFSCGVREVCFVEKNRECLKLIRQNLESLGIDSFSLLPKDAFSAIKLLARESRRFDIVFLDPPYYPECSHSSKRYFPESSNFLGRASGFRRDTTENNVIRDGIPKSYRSSRFIRDNSLAKKCLITLSTYDILNANSFIIVQHHKEDKLPNSLSDLVLYKRYSYSDNQLSVYRIGI